MQASDKGAFPPTRWTLVDLAADRSAAEAVKALGELLERYLPALKAHLMYGRRLKPDRADDLIHSFIAEKILEGELLGRADRDRGKFRTFLLTALDRYTISQFRKEQAARRSPGEGAMMALDEVADWVEDDAATPRTSAYDLAWIREIIHETLRRVERECTGSGRESYWRIFEARVANPILHGAAPEPYDRIVGRLGFPTPMQASNALITVKRMFERQFRAVIREYVGDEKEVEEEIRELNAILAGVRA